LFGHSYGGPIAGYIGYLNPDQILHSILAGGAVDPEQEKFVWTGVLCNLPGIYHISSNDTKSATKEKLGHRSALVEIEDSWDNIKIQITAMHGDKDWMVPFGNVHFLEDKMEKGLLKIDHLVGDDHFFFTDIPLVTNSLVRIGNLYNQGK
jgi:pimeloyl-ACP methyl ester carboxylesterase